MVVEAEPDVAAAMDILSFALYHENNQVIGENDVVAAGQKRQREEHDLTDATDPEDDENDSTKRQREDASSQEHGGTTLADLKQTIFQELSRTLEDSMAVDDIATTVDVDRDLVLKAIQQLEAENRIMHSDGEVYLIDWSDCDYFEELFKICEQLDDKMHDTDRPKQKTTRELSYVGSFITWSNL